MIKCVSIRDRDVLDDVQRMEVTKMEKRQRITFDIQRECGWFKEEKKGKLLFLKKEGV